MAPSGFKLGFPRLLIQFTNGLYVPGKNAIEMNAKLQKTIIAKSPDTTLIGHFFGIGKDFISFFIFSESIAFFTFSDFIEKFSLYSYNID